VGRAVLRRSTGITHKRLVNDFNLRQEAVSAPGNRLNKARILGRVAQDFPDFLDGVVQPMLGVAGAVSRQLRIQLLAGNDFPGTTSYSCQYFERLFLQLDPEPIFFSSRASRSISKMPNRKPCGDCDVLDTSNSTLKRRRQPFNWRISPLNHLSYDALEKLSAAEFRRIDVLGARGQYA
jgi:hypothetical protein